MLGGGNKARDHVPQGEKFLEHRIYGNLACGIDFNHHVLCWGGEPSRFLSSNFRDGSFFGDLKANHITLDYSSICILDLEGILICRGEKEELLPNSPNSKFQKIGSSSQGMACGVLEDQSLKCWDWGDEKLPSYSLPTNIQYKQIFDHWRSYLCALSLDDYLFCVGDSKFSFPKKGIKVKGASVSYQYFCAVKQNNQVQCWGKVKDRKIPENILAKKVFLGNIISCIIKMDDSVQCWGDSENSYTLTQIPKGMKAKSIEMAGGIACALQMDDTLKCWGERDFIRNMRKIPEVFQ